MNAKDYQASVELNILRLIEQRLKSGEMDAQRAQEIARYVLQTTHADMTLDEVYRIIPSLTGQLPELSALSASVLTDYETTVKDAVMPQVHAMLQQGKFEDAIQIIRKALNHEMHVE